jgi:predicted Zn-dependent protease
MLQEIRNDEGMMAAVMGHEFGHLIYKHSGRGARGVATNVLGVLAGVVAGAVVPGGGLGANIAANAINLGGKAARCAKLDKQCVSRSFCHFAYRLWPTPKD